jgi:hypothetical protein
MIKRWRICGREVENSVCGVPEKKRARPSLAQDIRD